MTKSLSRNTIIKAEGDEIFLKYQYRVSPKTGQREVCGIELSDGTKSDSAEFMKKLEEALRDRTELTFTVLEGKIDSSIENFSSEV